MHDLPMQHIATPSRTADAGAAALQSNRIFGIDAERTVHRSGTTPLDPRSDACVNPTRCLPTSSRIRRRH